MYQSLEEDTYLAECMNGGHCDNCFSGTNLDHQSMQTLKRMTGVPADAAHKHAITHGILHAPSDQLLHIFTQLLL